MAGAKFCVKGDLALLENAVTQVLGLCNKAGLHIADNCRIWSIYEQLRAQVSLKGQSSNEPS